MLSYGNDDRLVVGSSVDWGESVDPSRETTCDFSGKDAALDFLVQPLEESKVLWVCGGGLIENLKLNSFDQTSTNPNYVI